MYLYEISGSHSDAAEDFSTSPAYGRTVRSAFTAAVKQAKNVGN
jgi:hypothetical protein